MDKKQAQFILQGFRPDGADALSDDFAEALMLAAGDRELGEWLAAERAADAVFAVALGSVEIPERLRQDILDRMDAGERAETGVDNEFDRMCEEAFAEIEPPRGLRDDVLTAMGVQVGLGEVAYRMKRKPLRRVWLQWGGVAAALVLGVFWAVQFTEKRGLQPQRLAMHEVQNAVAELLGESLKLDRRSEDLQEINTWLVGNRLPQANDLPSGLRGVKSIGCKVIVLPGEKRASLVCFSEQAERSLHLLILRNDDIEGDVLPALKEVIKKDCRRCSIKDWQFVRWRDKDFAYLLMARNKNTKGRSNSLFRYF